MCRGTYKPQRNIFLPFFPFLFYCYYVTEYIGLGMSFTTLTLKAFTRSFSFSFFFLVSSTYIKNSFNNNNNKKKIKLYVTTDYYCNNIEYVYSTGCIRSDINSVTTMQLLQIRFK